MRTVDTPSKDTTEQSSVSPQATLEGTQLLIYPASPNAPGQYFQRAWRELGSVISCGPSYRGAPPADIPASNVVDVMEAFREASRRVEVTAVIVMDGAYPVFPKNIRDVPVPTAFYAYDPHTSIRWYRQIAGFFDLVFTTQKQYLPDLKAAGCSKVEWVPLACDPTTHARDEAEQIYDVCFVGSVLPQAHVRRQRLLSGLKREFNYFRPSVFGREVSRAYAQGKIIFNCSLNNDLNMRVFEGPSSGGFLLTDRIYENGIEDLFTDRGHLVMYEDHDLHDLVRYYLAHDSERKEIAEAGFAHVRAHHTYAHRVQQMCTSLATVGKPARRANSLRYAGALAEFRVKHSALGARAAGMVHRRRLFNKARVWGVNTGKRD